MARVYTWGTHAPTTCHLPHSLTYTSHPCMSLACFCLWFCLYDQEAWTLFRPEHLERKGERERVRAWERERARVRKREFGFSISFLFSSAKRIYWGRRRCIRRRVVWSSFLKVDAAVESAAFSVQSSAADGKHARDKGPALCQRYQHTSWWRGRRRYFVMALLPTWEHRGVSFLTPFPGKCSGLDDCTMRGGEQQSVAGPRC